MQLVTSIGVKRLSLALVLVVVTGFAALVAMTELIPADTIRDAVKAEIRATTGLDPILRGNVSVSLFPSGAISYDDVVLGDGAGGEPALTAASLTARLRFFPLLAGRIEIADIALTRPRIAVIMTADGRSNWSGLVAALRTGLRPSEPRPDAFSEILITGGSVHFVDPKHGIDERMEDVDASLAWPSISRSFAASGRFTWRYETVTGSVGLTDFLAALSGERSGLRLRLAAAPLKLAFDGSLSAKPTLKIDGTLASDSTSLRDALTWFGRKPLPGGGFGRFALKAQASVVGGNVGLSAVNVELDGNSAEGVLNFVTEGRQVIQGTLAADALDLTPYLSTVRLLTGNERDWSRLPIALDGLDGVDIDLRMSAAQVKLGSASLGRTAVAANLREGRLNVTVGESQAFGGVIKGSVGLAGVDDGADFKSQLQFTDVDLDACLGTLFGLHRLDGRGSLAFSIEGKGANVLALTGTLNGRATLVGRQGALTGVDVEQMLRRLERRPLSNGGSFRNGRTPYDRLNVALRISQGTVSIEDMSVDGTSVRIKVEGSASIPARELDLTGTASLAATADKQGFALPFVVQGPWDDPLPLFDAQALIRHSGAAAPLLNAARDRGLPDAVRRALDRLTGGRTPPEPAAPAAAATPVAAPDTAPEAASAPSPAPAAAAPAKSTESKTTE